MLPLTLATVLLDPPTTLFAGAVIALISMKLISLDPEREVKRTVIFSLIWAAAWSVSIAYMYFAYPDWMLVYLKDAASVPLVPVFIVFVVLLIVGGWVGAYATAELLARKKTGLAVLLAVGALAWLGFIGWLQAPQYAVVGTFAEYAAGKAPLMSENKGAQFGMTIATIINVLVSVPMIVVRVVQTRKAMRASSTAARPA